MKMRWSVWFSIAALCVSSASAELIVRLTFDDTLTNAVSSAYGAVSIGSSTPKYSTDAEYGKSMLFSNPVLSVTASQKLSILNGGNWAGTNSWTFSAWLKPTMLNGTTSTIFGAIGGAGNYTLYSSFRGGNIITYYDDDGTNALKSTSVAWTGTTNDWYRLTYVFNADDKSFKLYRDNSDAAGGVTLLGGTANFYTPMTLSNLVVGANGLGAVGYKGYMDDVRIYNTALTQAEVDVIPEPATIGLFGLAGAVVLILRRVRGCLG